MRDFFSRIFQVVSELIKWIIRPVNIVLKAGTTLMLLGFGGLNFFSKAEGQYISSDGEVYSFSLQNADTGMIVSGVLFFIGIVGFLMILYEVFYLIKKRNKISHVAIEHIALKQRISNPFIESVNKIFTTSVPLTIDLTGCYKNGVVIDPERALNITSLSLEDNLKAHVQQMGTREITIHYGGTPPVPFGFLAGYLLGNTSNIQVWDYNRDDGWYKVDCYGDTNDPVVDWGSYQMASDSVCLLLGISFPVTTESVGIRVANGSFVKVSMPKTEHDNMSSLDKLKRFQSEFRKILNKFTADGVKTVNIFCAAQASFNFCMGRQITKNHPTCIVYEYVHSESGNKYPWGVSFNSKDSQPSIVN